MKMLKNVINLFNKKLDFSILSQTIEKDGWVVIDEYSGELLNLMENICSKLKLDISFHNYKKLIPKDKNEVEHFSLSSAYGLKEFPLHTDGAEYKTPPRFLVLRALSDSPTGTYIADANSICDNINVCNTKWSVKTKDGIVKTKLYQQHPKYNIEFIRFNRLSMKCDEGDKLDVYKAIDNLTISSIIWSENKTIIIDNWRVLHGRPTIIEDDYEKRIIERLQVFI
jgi:alpha-ketoglutarate-dependent taurine dioxygenase